MTRSPRTNSLALTLWLLLLTPLAAQSQRPAADPQQITTIERRLNDLNDTLTQTQAALQQSQAELTRLRAEIAALRDQTATATPDLQALKEQQEVLQSEIKQHEQTKVESASKYSLTVTGLALFNAFSNAGVVDETELPAFALPGNPGSSHGSLGATLRQSVIGIVATGPVVAGAHSSASINIDFFGGATTNSFGYSALEGSLRMRDTQLSLAWKNTILQAGYTAPIISPLSPTSFATVARPALSGSGNLWTWSPQLQVEHDIPLTPHQSLSLEAGLISPQSPGYTSIQLDSPTQASRRPGLEARIAYHGPFVFGVGAYTARQSYSSSTRIHSWAITGDWQLPLSKYVEISGEIYRGRSLAGLGGGLYKDIVTGTDPVTGLTRTIGVETAGGWTQLKLILSPRWEANSMFGLDDAFSSTFRGVYQPTAYNSLTTTARNGTMTTNLIFRPRASIIFSPEYRRVLTWRYTGAPYTANIFTLSAGYKF